MLYTTKDHTEFMLSNMTIALHFKTSSRNGDRNAKYRTNANIDWWKFKFLNILKEFAAGMFPL